MRTFLFALILLGCGERGSPPAGGNARPGAAHASTELRSADAPALRRGSSVPGIWIHAAEIATLPADGPAWEALHRTANAPVPAPELSNQDTRTNVTVLAQALVFARTGEERYRNAVLAAVRRAMGTEHGGSTLPLSRKLISYVIAAELVTLTPELDSQFRLWLRGVMDTKLKGRTVRSTHEDRPNNWGTHAGASRVAVARFLGLEHEIERCARVFRGWLGGRVYYADFEFGKDRSWQADAKRPVGINPAGASRKGHSIDGVLPDDQRRGGAFRWPPPQENYVYEALQGALAQAVMLERAGYDDIWEWEDRALLRAFEWLHAQAQFPPQGDDTWQAPLIDRHYGTGFWDGTPTRPGKSLGWTDWTHASP